MRWRKRDDRTQSDQPVTEARGLWRLGFICDFPQAIRFRPAISVWVLDLSARLYFGGSLGIMKELTPLSLGGSPEEGSGGSRLTPLGRSLGDKYLFRELPSAKSDDSNLSQRRPPTLELGGWREAGKPKTSHEL